MSREMNWPVLLKAKGLPLVVKDEKAGYNRFLLLVAGLGGLLYGVDVASLLELCPIWRHLRLNCGPAFHRRRCCPLGQRDFDLVCRAAGGLDGAQPLMMLSGLLFVSAFP